MQYRIEYKQGFVWLPIMFDIPSERVNGCLKILEKVIKNDLRTLPIEDTVYKVK